MLTFYNTHKRLFWIIGFFLVIRAGLLIYNSSGLELNPDEYPNYHIAENWLQEKGYTRLDETTGTYKKLAFYGSFTIWVYALFIFLGISIAYWVLAVQLAFLAAYAVSVFYFYKLLTLFIQSGKIRLFGAVVYAAYPSTLFYIGSIFWYENLTVPALIYVMYQLTAVLNNQRISRFNFYFIPVLITLSCLFRGQALFIYFFILSAYILLLFRRKTVAAYGKKVILLPALTALLICATHIPILIKNNQMFGGWLLSTQPGFELLQGHNPYANGKWTMDWYKPGQPLHEYAAANIPDLKSLDEYAESRKRADLAFSWIKANPGAELKLILKKIVVYFTPDNSPPYPGNNLPGFDLYNPLNFLVHLVFLVALLFSIFSKRFRFNQFQIFLLTPVAATLLLSIIFFAGWRWRFYAEPFMILAGCVFIQKLIPAKKIPAPELKK